MSICLALAGNPNCGKTTMFNELTGATQYVGNWPGVTVEKKEGKWKADKSITIMDLPGIYSLSPYTLEEVITREYLVDEKPDAIMNIVDASNIERNLYLTTQLLEMGIPVVVALNMMDIVEKRGDTIDVKKLSEMLGAPVVETAAIKGKGTKELVEAAKKAAASKHQKIVHTYSETTETAFLEIEKLISGSISPEQSRWYAIKIFERDEKVIARLNLSKDILNQVEAIIVAAEEAFDDDCESIVTDERYTYIGTVVKKSVKKKQTGLSVSDKIDRVVTNRILALPIFAIVMAIVYYIAISTVGDWATGWTNDGLFGDGWHLTGGAAFEEATGEYETQVAMRDAYIEAAEEAGADVSAITEVYEAEEFDAEAAALAAGELALQPNMSSLVAIAELEDEDGTIEEISVDSAAFIDAAIAEEPAPEDFGTWVRGIPVVVEEWLSNLEVADWLQGLILEGIIGGVGAVLGFVPQMLILFILLAILEECGYMARIAFIMDRIFRRFGLSGKSFIPMLIGSGCGVPAVMASRTIEQQRDRRMTIMTTCFVPCGAKLPIIALFAGALFDNAGWVAWSAYFIGIAAIIISGIMLKKLKAFAGDPAPFVMELPAYHRPTVGSVLRSMWERGWSFIRKAGTIILVSAVILWFLQGFGWTDGTFGMVEDNNTSILASIGSLIAPVFAPLGFGTWQAAVATFTGLIAKENVVGAFGVFYGFAEVAEEGNEIWANIATDYTALTAYSFMIFNLLCAPCFAAMGAIKREMNNTKWTWAAIGYMTGLAYTVSLMVYQFGGLFTGEVSFGVGTIVALIVLAGYLYLLFRKPYDSAKGLYKVSKKA